MRKCKFVVYGNYNATAPKLYAVVRQQEEKGWTVFVCPCDNFGAIIADPVEFKKELSWLSAIYFFNKWYNEYQFKYRII